MYEPIPRGVKGLTLARVLMTVCVMEFFGPWGRDYSDTHLFNPDWVGHARLHMMWLLGFMLFSGVANVYLIWFTRPLRPIQLYVSFAWLAANFFGFWLAIATVPVYEGLVVVEGIHIDILGVDENVFAFSVLGLIYVAAFAVFRLRVIPQLAKRAA